MFEFLPKKKLFLSAASFIVVEICLGYNVGAFWVMVEESCNIQQAKRLFNLINYGTVVSMGTVGVAVFYVPWYRFMSPASLMTLGAVFSLPCIPLMNTIAPKGKPTNANAQKDRNKVEARMAKEKSAQKKAAANAAKKVAGANQLTMDDFQVMSAKQSSVIIRLLADPMIPALFVAMSIMWSFDAIYSWQFFSLLENNLQITFPPCFERNEDYSSADFGESLHPGAKCGDPDGPTDGWQQATQEGACVPCLVGELPENKQLYDERIGNALAKYQVWRRCPCWTVCAASLPLWRCGHWIE